MWSRERKVGIYGGTFNPPTRGHMQLADAIVSRGYVDEIWLMPNYETYGKHASSPEQRLEMTRLATLGIGGLNVCDFEIRKAITGGTYNVMRAFLDGSSLPCKFYFIIGDDAADTLPSWDENSYKLPEMLPFIVVHRTGYTSNVLEHWYKKHPHMFVDDLDIPEVSSTMVRDMLAHQQYDKLFRAVPFSVLDYIYHYNLYTGDIQ